jgi:aminoglycoside phosphotransferase (APT) family kinase protein
LGLDLDACAALWTEAMALPSADDSAPPRWHHGDLVAENLLVRDGRLAAVLDFGGLSLGDPTVDLVVAWEVLDPEARGTFREEVGVDDGDWLRGRAWALAIAVMTFPYYWATMPGRCADRLALARAVLADHAST